MDPYECTYCHSLVTSHRIKCAECPDFTLCLQVCQLQHSCGRLDEMPHMHCCLFVRLALTGNSLDRFVERLAITVNVMSLRTKLHVCTSEVMWCNRALEPTFVGSKSRVEIVDVCLLCGI